MYETVKVVKGYAIQRMKGYRGSYRVTLKVIRDGFEKVMFFKTIKAAAAYIEAYL